MENLGVSKVVVDTKIFGVYIEEREDDNMRIICLMGKTCSGKSTLEKEMIEKGYNEVISYTTRPPRKGEVDGVNYHFRSEDEFNELAENGVLQEWEEYGGYHYGSPVLEKGKTYVMVVEPKGYRRLRQIHGYNVLGIYRDVPEKELKKRIRERCKGESKEFKLEMNKRLKDDRERFEGIEGEADMVLSHKHGLKKLEELLAVLNDIYDTVGREIK